MIVAGFGGRAGATAASYGAALAMCGATPAALAAPADRVHALASLSDALGVPLLAMPPDRLAAIETPTLSPASLAARGTGSVAEACAIAAAGPGARLLVTRRVSPDGRATCAIAESMR